MTAILGFSYLRLPVLIGDVMVSQKSKFAPKSTYVPSTGNIAIPSDVRYQYRICDLVQKVSIVGKNLAIAYTGDFDSARNLLTVIQDANNISPFDYKTLTTYLDNESPSLTAGKFSIIVLIKDGESWRLFARNIQQCEEGNFSPYFEGGTGGKDLAAQLNNLPSSPCLSNDATPLQNIMALGASLSGTLITHEIHHPTSLKNVYGGAYEVLSINENGCTKLDNILYVKWFADYENGKLTKLKLTHLFRYLYWNDFLIIRTVNFSGDLTTNDDSYTIIPTVFKNLETGDVDNAPTPELNAQIVSHQITFRAKNGDVYTFSRIDFSKPDVFNAIETTLSDNKHQIEVRHSNTFIKEISDALSEIVC